MQIDIKMYNLLVEVNAASNLEGNCQYYKSAITMANTHSIDSEPFTLPPAGEFLAPCPKFRLLVLGNIESTKVEIFSKVLGVNFDKVSSPDLEREVVAGLTQAERHCRRLQRHA